MSTGILQISALLFTIYFGSNALLYLVSIPFTYALIFMIFLRLISISSIQKILWMFFIVIGGIMLVQLNFVDIEEISAVSEILVTYNIAIVGFCLLYYFQMLQIPEELSPSRQGIFWIVSGFFFYFLLSFAYWIIISYFARSIPGLRYFNVCLVIIFYLVLWLGIFVHLNEKRVHGAQ